LAEKDEIGSKGQDAEKAQTAAKTRIQELNDMMKQCGQQQQNTWTPYGRDIQKVLDQIQHMKWYGEKPLGPLGHYVKVKDPQSWAELLRSQLSHLLTAFAVTDTRDRPQLKGLLNKYQKLEFTFLTVPLLTTDEPSCLLASVSLSSSPREICLIIAPENPMKIN